MICEQTQELLTSYQQDELDSAIKARVEDHLSDCAVCRSESDEIYEVLSLFSSVGEFEPPAEVWENIQAEISKPVASVPVTPASPSPRRPALLLSGFLMAAAVLFFVLGLDGLLRPTRVADATLVSGKMTLKTPDGEQRLVLGKRFAIWPGSQLSADTKRCAISLGPQGELTLGRETKLSFRRGMIELSTGSIYLRETGGTNWRIRTPHMQLQLVGTEVELTVTGRDTRLKVLDGSVKLHSGPRLLITKGQSIRVNNWSETTDPVVRFNPEVTRAAWLASALKAQLTLFRDGPQQKQTLHFRLTNTSAEPIPLSSDSGRYCQLRVKRNGKQLPAIPVPLIQGSRNQPLRLAPGESHTYRFDASELSESGQYEVQGVYMVGRSGLRAISPPITFRVP